MQRERVHARTAHHFTSDPARVFDAWLDPGLVRVWLRAALLELGVPGDITTVAIDPRVGGAFEFSDRRVEGEARHWGRYLRLDRPREIAFTWITDPSEEEDPSIVTVTITPEGAGCRVEVVHEMSPEWRDYLDRTALAWARMLRGIEACLAPAGAR